MINFGYLTVLGGGSSVGDACVAGKNRGAGPASIPVGGDSVSVGGDSISAVMDCSIATITCGTDVGDGSVGVSVGSVGVGGAGVGGAGVGNADVSGVGSMDVGSMGVGSAGAGSVGVGNVGVGGAGVGGVDIRGIGVRLSRSGVLTATGGTATSVGVTSGGGLGLGPFLLPRRCSSSSAPTSHEKERNKKQRIVIHTVCQLEPFMELGLQLVKHRT